MKVLKPLLFILLTPLTIILLYGLVAFILTFFPVNSPVDNSEKNETIYLIHDEMHSDIVINLETSTMPWGELLPEVIRNRSRGYIAFGWGDKETYLSTPTWDEIKTSTALKALFINTSSLMHITFYSDINHYSNVKKISLSREQYTILEKSLLKDFDNKPQYKANGYGYNDAFYHSPSIYNIIKTCNTWTGDRLREANITMSYWTPFSYNVLNSLP
ncbi:MAG: DUF2459 domain-containing protein [Epsilonproteobacteria bacterium]|nr:DUF2459 domain-containing protein [Campylobacterota bacterium]